MIASLQNGLAKETNVIAKKDSNRDNAPFMAINHCDHEIVRAMLNAGTSTAFLDQHSLGLQESRTKESDEVFFVRQIFETSLTADLSIRSITIAYAFHTAVYTWNQDVAKYLSTKEPSETNLRLIARQSLEIWYVSQNTCPQKNQIPPQPAGRRLGRFFLINHFTWLFSALCFAALSADKVDWLSQQADISDLIIARLLNKYNSEEHFNSTDGTGGMTALMTAAGFGNYRVVRRLLERSRSASIGFGRTHSTRSLMSKVPLSWDVINFCAEGDWFRRRQCWDVSEEGQREHNELVFFLRCTARQNRKASSLTAITGRTVSNPLIGLCQGFGREYVDDAYGTCYKSKMRKRADKALKVRI